MTDQGVSLRDVTAAVPETATVAPDTATASPNMDARVPSQQAMSAAESTDKAKEDNFDSDLLQKLLESINREYEQRSISVRFKLHEDTNSTIIKVMDIDTDKLIRQVPPDEILTLRTRMRELLGEIFDAQA